MPGDADHHVQRLAGRHRLETVVVQRPRCPACGGVRLRKYRSLADQGDGSALWWVRCADPCCAYRFRVLLECDDCPSGCSRCWNATRNVMLAWPRPE